jgi:uncharacterized membrane protein
MVTPFDLKSAILAKHAQHVVLIHFPIALYISAALMGALARITNRARLADAAYYNMVLAAWSAIPVVISGVLAWQFQLEAQKPSGVLLLHMILAGIASLMIWFVCWMHFRARDARNPLPGYFMAVEFAGVVAIILAAHLGGFLTGVNGPP